MCLSGIKDLQREQQLILVKSHATNKQGTPYKCWIFFMSDARCCEIHLTYHIRDVTLLVMLLIDKVSFKTNFDFDFSNFTPT